MVIQDTCINEFSNINGVFDTTIRFTTQVGRSEAKRMSLYEYDRTQKVTIDYTNLTFELIKHIYGDEMVELLKTTKKTLKKRNN